MVYVALLRGINVGGNNSISMSKLKECFETLGFKNVKTYINSGNVIFSGAKKSNRVLEKTLEEKVHKQFNFPVTIVIYTKDEIDSIVKVYSKEMAYQ